jgi:mannose/fructose/sorbose-specific phosphotransferase system IIA component
MVLGDFDYLSPVTFLPGEGPENLIEKYKESISSFDNDYGTLFLVDIFGGSPYNAASMMVMENENMDVVSGVNVPMLLELLDVREDIDKVEELKEVAKESGKSGIEVFSEVFKNMMEEQNNTDELDDLGEL